MRRKSAILLLIITGVLWSTGGLLIKLIPWSPISIAGIRSGLSALIIYLYRKPYSKGFGRNIWAGAFCYSVMVVSFVLANKITASGNVILIQYAAPIYVALFGYSFLGEKASKIDWITIAIIIFGLSCFFYEDLSLKQKWGNVLAIFSGLGFAGLTLFMRKEKNANPIDCVLLGNLITFVVCLPFYFTGVTMEVTPWLSITFLGFVQLGLAYILFSTAIKYVNALDAIIYPVIEPLFNPLLTFIFIGEQMSQTALIGGCLVITGVIGRGYLSEASN
jgi:drug/metabolite transporter (DMT)-like permease